MLTLTEITMDDREFARWLKERGWSGKVEKELTGEHGISAFIDDNGALLCKVLYDNTNSTYRIFIR